MEGKKKEEKMPVDENPDNKRCQSMRIETRSTAGQRGVEANEDDKVVCRPDFGKL
jgi:hypothetical protein